MRAIILAAGRGSRMKKMTDPLPKCMIKLDGRPLLHWQINSLQASGIEEITVVRGYKKERIIGPYHSYIDNSLWKTTNMVYSLFCASCLLDQEPCIISYSDIVYRPSIVDQLIKIPGAIVVSYDQKWRALWEERFTNPLNDAEELTLSKGLITSIGRSPTTLEIIEGQYMGLLKITPTGWLAMKRVYHELPQNLQMRIDMTTFLQLLIESDFTIHASGVAGGWCEVDRKEDIELYEKKLLSSNWMHRWF